MIDMVTGKRISHPNKIVFGNILMKKF